tara:strand:+ start:6593 stop:6760 length:168 start_codon:yes stop_codon:yes gene_type:complete
MTKIYDDFFAKVIDFEAAVDKLVDLGVSEEDARSGLASMMTINFTIIDDLESGTR